MDPFVVSHRKTTGWSVVRIATERLWPKCLRDNLEGLSKDCLFTYEVERDRIRGRLIGDSFKEPRQERANVVDILFQVVLKSEESQDQFVRASCGLGIRP